ncbi:substrate-binding domain-containing protein [Cohnella sp. LGH]|uniref:GntR family transcriptional regulator n=1 Tax=Cohnella sp. LGH TaxID=1619153 RepID=UPI001ADB9AE3|nr:substrate-binding domain-containing protein [Cohnella sp. LGH]QTH44450.1 substrate-binding domain-containing protein [Cohnella sp. LGH]
MSTNERVPLYQQIQDYIRDIITVEEMKAGDRIPTEKELLERFQVSKITVAKALTGLADEQVITRVPGKGSFVTDKGAKKSAPSSAVAVQSRDVGERQTRTGLIGLVMPSIDDYFAIRLIKGIQHTLESEGYRSMIMLSSGKIEKEKAAIKELKALEAEGLLIFPVDEENYNEEILSMKFEGFPFVLMDRHLPGVETHFIASDGRQGVRLAIDHLWELGHREIAICSDSPLLTVTVQERIEGYISALKDKGALINPAHMITGFTLAESLKESEAHPLFRYIRNQMATAYISLNGRLSVHIYQMARQAGLDVPGDVSIVSFDDPTSIVEEGSIFTHINQFEREMGVKAAGKLLEVIRGERNVKHFDKTLIEPRLVIRQTSGPNRQR